MKTKCSCRIDEVQSEITSTKPEKPYFPGPKGNYNKSERTACWTFLKTGKIELPFVGELIKVKEDSLHWERSIKRVLQ